MDRFYFDSMFESSNYGLDLDLDYFNDYNDYFLENEYDKYYDEFNYFLENELDNYSDYNYFLENEYDLSYYTPLNEGVWDNIKNWIKMIIDKIVGAYRSMVNFFKSLFAKSDANGFNSNGPSAEQITDKATETIEKIEEKAKEEKEKTDDTAQKEKIEEKAKEAVKQVVKKAVQDVSVAPPTTEELKAILKIDPELNKYISDRTSFDIISVVNHIVDPKEFEKLMKLVDEGEKNISYKKFENDLPTVLRNAMKSDIVQVQFNDIIDSKGVKEHVQKAINSSNRLVNICTQKVTELQKELTDNTNMTGPVHPDHMKAIEAKRTAVSAMAAHLVKSFNALVDYNKKYTATVNHVNAAIKKYRNGELKAKLNNKWARQKPYDPKRYAELKKKFRKEDVKKESFYW